jgi:hypothetical protein
MGRLNANSLDMFTGRPRFGIRLLEALLVGESVETLEKDLLVSLGDLLDKLKTYSINNTSPKSIYSELQSAATSWILKGEGAIKFGGVEALEVGVASLRVKDNAFSIHEPLILRVLGDDLSSKIFENLTNEPAEQIGNLFEDYLAWHSQELLNVLVCDDVMNLAATATEFVGPWKVYAPCGDMRRGTKVDDDAKVISEASLISDILDNNQKENFRGCHLVFPCEKFGGDIIIVGYREVNSQCQHVVMIVQAKACMQTSTPAAMKSLRYPYYTNRDKTPTPPEPTSDYGKALNNYKTLLLRDDVHVVFVVFKYPANSQNGYKRFEVKPLIDMGLPEKNVLEIVLDSSNAERVIVTLRNGLQRMKMVKETNVNFWHDG